MKKKNPHAVALGKLGGSAGTKAQLAQRRAAATGRRERGVSVGGRPFTKPGFYWFDRMDSSGQVIGEWIVELDSDGRIYTIGSEMNFHIVPLPEEDEDQELAYEEIFGKLVERIERKKHR